MPKNQSKLKAPTPAARTAGASGGTLETSGGGGGPCKLTAVDGPGNEFQIKKTDMPVSFSLSTPDGKSEFSAVKVARQADIKNPISGQPTSLSGRSFSVNITNPDSYIVLISVGGMPSALPVSVLESCAGGQEVDFIVIPSTLVGTGQFTLTVV